MDASTPKSQGLSSSQNTAWKLENEQLFLRAAIGQALCSWFLVLGYWLLVLGFYTINQ